MEDLISSPFSGAAGSHLLLISTVWKVGDTCSEKPDKCYDSQWSRSTPTAVSHGDRMCPWYAMLNTAPPLYVSRDTELQRHHNRNTREIPVKRPAIKCPTSTIRNCQGPQTRKYDRLSQPRGASGDVITVQQWPRWDPGTEKGHWVNIKKVRIKGKLIANNVMIWFTDFNKCLRQMQDVKNKGN